MWNSSPQTANLYNFGFAQGLTSPPFDRPPLGVKSRRGFFYSGHIHDSKLRTGEGFSGPNKKELGRELGRPMKLTTIPHCPRSINALVPHIRKRHYFGELEEKSR